MLITGKQIVSSRKLNHSVWMSVRCSFVESPQRKRGMEEKEAEPEVWKYLEGSPTRNESKKQMRLEKAKKFLKMTEQRCIVGRNTFRVQESTADIALPPPLPQETGPPPPPPTPLCHNNQQQDNQRGSALAQNSQLYGGNPPSILSAMENRSDYRTEMYRESVSLRASGGGGGGVDRLTARRPWIHNDNQVRMDGGLNFRLLSYNVLAQNLLEAHPQLYRGLDPDHLGWNHRWSNIQREVQQFRPDIVCLQEVQFRRPNHFKTDYLPFFESLGYRAVFKCRTGDKNDGCVVFYRTRVFKLDVYSLVEYRQRGVPILDRDNIGIVCRLVVRGRSDLPPLIVATTHLLFNRKRTDIRLAQAAILLAEIDRLGREEGGVCQRCPAIITGDFNANPSSEVYTLLDQGRIDYEGLRSGSRPMPAQLLPPGFGLTDTCQWANLIQNQADMPVVLNTSSFSQQFGFKSVHQEWEHPDAPSHNKVVSTNHGDWTVVDFIFYSQGTHSNLHLQSRMMLPRDLDMDRIGRIPSDVCPSDHFPLVADFALVPR